MSARPFRHLCPEADLRDAMTDDEFWAHVFPQDGPDGINDDTGPFDGSLMNPCPVCGEWGPCGYDDEGRVLIRWMTAEDGKPETDA